MSIKGVVQYLFLACILMNTRSAVIELTDRDFDERLKDRNAMVMFYSPNCGHCMRYKPGYETLSGLKSIATSGTLMARIDCTENGKKTCQKYAVSGYPTLKFISRVGKTEAIEDYKGSREQEHVEQFILTNSRDPIVRVTDEAISDFVESNTLPVVFGFFKDAKSKLYMKLEALSPQFKKNYIIGYTFSEPAAKKMGQTIESIVVYWQQQYKTPVDDQKPVCKSEKDLISFLSKNKFSIVEYRYPDNEEEFKTPIITAYIPIDPLKQRSAAKRLRNVMVKQARDNQDITFTISKKSDYETFVTDIAPNAGNKDIHLVALDKDGKKYLCKDIPSFEDHKEFEAILKQFVSDFTQGNVLEPFVKSEPIPASDDGHVKVVVAKTFESIVIDNDNDVLIEFYAPWCGHCKKLAPLYQQLATLLKDETKLVIAKYDATANDPQKNFGVEGFPTIFLAKAGKKSSPVQYSGKRDTSSFIKWLKKESTHGIKFSGDVPEIKEDL